MFALLSTLVTFSARAGSDPIGALPNYKGPELCFKQYSGYLPVEGGAKNLFHWSVFPHSTAPSLQEHVFSIVGKVFPSE